MFKQPRLCLAKALLAVAIPMAPLAEAVNCDGYAAWNPAAAYIKGDKVTYEQTLWSAKNSSLGVTPGTQKRSWTGGEACDSDSGGPPGTEPTIVQIYGVWHAGDHYADWSQPMDMAAFAANNHWLLDRGDGQPSVNLVVLSFLQPLQVLALSSPVDGVPPGMTGDIVNYFKNAGIRVMMSIGGITYTDFWTEALATDATQLGLNAAAIASHYGVGMEIDYEEASDPDLEGLQLFIDAYRSVHPYDASGTNHAARLTIDLAAGGRYLQGLNLHATLHWLNNSNPVLDYANAMVHRASGTPTHWQEHIDGKPTYDPPIPPKAPNRFTGGLFLKGSMDNCTDYEGSEQKAHRDYVETVAPVNASVGTSRGMLGYMFWAAGKPSARKNYTPTYPPHSCEGGMGEAAVRLGFPVPMAQLRQN